MLRTVERRQRDRVSLRLPCRVERFGRPAAQGCSVTENISRAGILIRWNQEELPPAVGEPVIVEVETPLGPVSPRRWMLFRARVVRVAAVEQDLMVAVSGSPLQPVRSNSPRYVN